MENTKNPDSKSELHPFYITGLSEGKAFFHLAIGKNSKYKNGLYVKLGFSIVLHKKDQMLLEKIKAHFGGIGTLTPEKKCLVKFRVFSMNDLKVIIDHFDKYPARFAGR